MEEWRNGGMEGWRNGRVEEWRSGGMEERRNTGEQERRRGGVVDIGAHHTLQTRLDFYVPETNIISLRNCC